MKENKAETTSRECGRLCVANIKGACVAAKCKGAIITPRQNARARAAAQRIYKDLAVDDFE